MLERGFYTRVLQPTNRQIRFMQWVHDNTNFIFLLLIQGFPGNNCTGVFSSRIFCKMSDKSDDVKIAAYGSWSSPITSEIAVQGGGLPFPSLAEVHTCVNDNNEGILGFRNRMS